MTTLFAESQVEEKIIKLKSLDKPDLSESLILARDALLGTQSGVIDPNSLFRFPEPEKSGKDSRRCPPRFWVLCGVCETGCLETPGRKLYTNFIYLFECAQNENLNFFPIAGFWELIWFLGQSIWFLRQPIWFLRQRIWFLRQPIWYLRQRIWFLRQPIWFLTNHQIRLYHTQPANKFAFVVAVDGSVCADKAFDECVTDSEIFKLQLPFFEEKNEHAFFKLSDGIVCRLMVGNRKDGDKLYVVHCICGARRKSSLAHNAASDPITNAFWKLLFSGFFQTCNLEISNIPSRISRCTMFSKINMRRKWRDWRNRESPNHMNLHRFFEVAVASFALSDVSNWKVKKRVSRISLIIDRHFNLPYFHVFWRVSKKVTKQYCMERVFFSKKVYPKLKCRCFDDATLRTPQKSWKPLTITASRFNSLISVLCVLKAFLKQQI